MSCSQVPQDPPSCPPTQPPGSFSAPQSMPLPHAASGGGLTFGKTFAQVTLPSSPRTRKKNFQNLVPEDAHLLKEPSIYKGVVGVLFSEQDIESLSEPLRFTLVGKISGDRSKFPRSSIDHAFSNLGLAGLFNIQFLPRGYILVKLSTEEDFARLWTLGFLFVGGLSIRFSKWTPDFDYEIESSIVPVWVKILDLPFHLYKPEALFSVGNAIGKPLKIDEPTADFSRAAFARICVEIDVLAPLQSEIWVGWGSYKKFLKVEYERVPQYCTACKSLGHDQEVCYNKNRDRSLKLQEQGKSNYFGAAENNLKSQRVKKVDPNVWQQVRKKGNQRAQVDKEQERQQGNNRFSTLQDQSITGEEEGVQVEDSHQRNSISDIQRNGIEELINTEVQGDGEIIGEREISQLKEGISALLDGSTSGQSKILDTMQNSEVNNDQGGLDESMSLQELGQKSPLGKQLIENMEIPSSSKHLESVHMISPSHSWADQMEVSVQFHPEALCVVNQGDKGINAPLQAGSSGNQISVLLKRGSQEKQAGNQSGEFIVHNSIQEIVIHTPLEEDPPGIRAKSMEGGDQNRGGSSTSQSSAKKNIAKIMPRRRY